MDTEFSLLCDEDTLDGSQEWARFRESSTQAPPRVEHPTAVPDIPIIKSTPNAVFPPLVRETLLGRGIEEIKRLAVALDLPEEVVSRSTDLYKMAEETKVCRYKSLSAIVAAAVYIACRLESCPRTFREIDLHTTASKKDIGKCSSVLSQFTSSAVTPASYIHRFCEKLDLPQEVTFAAAHVTAQATRQRVGEGKQAVSIAAAAIYLVCEYTNIKKTQKEISNVAMVSEVTIRGAYRDLYPHQQALLPPNWTYSPSRNIPPFNTTTYQGFMSSSSTICSVMPNPTINASFIVSPKIQQTVEPTYEPQASERMDVKATSYSSVDFRVRYSFTPPSPVASEVESTPRTPQYDPLTPESTFDSPLSVPNTPIKAIYPSQTRSATSCAMSLAGVFGSLMEEDQLESGCEDTRCSAPVDDWSRESADLLFRSDLTSLSPESFISKD
eukprot:GILK01007923.1.p1 GENE.GILK01007923.1~~GILK01007923.1.p1  ORF type:complete len:483 (+),score=74.45 GILK01007923.1:128-1450(+)